MSKGTIAVTKLFTSGATTPEPSRLQKPEVIAITRVAK
jgi:hypothetical protein